MQYDRGTVARNVLDERRRHGYSQEWLARHIDISQAAMSLYERNLREIPTSVLIRFADTFGVTIEHLIEGRNDK